MNPFIYYLSGGIGIQKGKRGVRYVFLLGPQGKKGREREEHRHDSTRPGDAAGPPGVVMCRGKKRVKEKKKGKKICSPVGY